MAENELRLSCRNPAVRGFTSPVPCWLAHVSVSSEAWSNPARWSLLVSGANYRNDPWKHGLRCREKTETQRGRNRLTQQGRVELGEDPDLAKTQIILGGEWESLERGRETVPAPNACSVC